MEKTRSVRALEASNFFLADVQTGLGPFLAAYLASEGWNPGRVGLALTVSGVVSVLLQTPAGALVDRVSAKRAILLGGVLLLGCASILLMRTAAPWAVYTSQVVIGGAASFLGPALGAITMGLVGRTGFDRQFGRNQSFNSAGNVVTAITVGVSSHFFGNRSIFLIAAMLTAPTAASILRIRPSDIDDDLARGGTEKKDGAAGAAPVRTLAGDRVLLLFLACAFLFHFANAAMLPELGEMLSRGSSRTAAPFMSACILVTQGVIMCSAGWVGKLANTFGRRPLLLVGFGVLPVRAVLYTVTHATGALIAIQLLDGVANAIFGVVAVLVIADRTRGTGRFNLVQGALATAIGIGAALSNTFGGAIVQYAGFARSFLALGGVAALAFLLLLALMPETGFRPRSPLPVLQ